jgi:hypothetical protein
MLVEHRRALTVAGLLCVLSSAVLLHKIHETSFHGDESGWIASGNYYTRLLLTGDFQRSAWECRECGAWGSLNMHLGKLLIGIPLRSMSPESARPFLSYYDFDATAADNLQRGNTPPADLLLRARTASAVFGVLCCLSVFVIGYLAHSLWTGLTAAVLLLFNRLFGISVTRAMTDVHYNFFLLAAAVSMIAVVSASRRRSLMLASAGAGILAGLACSVKITGIVICALSFLTVILYKATLHRSAKKDLVLSVALFGCLSVSVVYLLNPYFWPSVNAFEGRR